MGGKSSKTLGSKALENSIWKWGALGGGFVFNRACTPVSLGDIGVHTSTGPNEGTWERHERVDSFASDQAAPGAVPDDQALLTHGNRANGPVGLKAVLGAHIVPVNDIYQGVQLVATTAAAGSADAAGVGAGFIIQSARTSNIEAVAIEAVQVLMLRLNEIFAPSTDIQNDVALRVSVIEELIRILKKLPGRPLCVVTGVLVAKSGFVAVIGGWRRKCGFRFKGPPIEPVKVRVGANIINYEGRVRKSLHVPREDNGSIFAPFVRLDAIPSVEELQAMLVPLHAYLAANPQPEITPTEPKPLDTNAAATT